MIISLFLAIFPNLPNFHPGNLQHVFEAYGKSNTTFENCTVEYNHTLQCYSLAIKTNGIEAAKFPGTYFTEKGFTDFDNELEKRGCFSHLKCLNANYIKDIHNQTTLVLKTIFHNQFSCLEENFVNASKMIDTCSSNDFSLNDHLLKCSKPTIPKLNCSDEEIALLNDAIDRSVEINKLTNESNGMFQKYSILGLMIIFLFSAFM